KAASESPRAQHETCNPQIACASKVAQTWLQNIFNNPKLLKPHCRSAFPLPRKLWLFTPIHACSNLIVGSVQTGLNTIASGLRIPSSDGSVRNSLEDFFSGVFTLPPIT